MSNSNEKITRKLRAILSADVKGYLVGVAVEDQFLPLTKDKSLNHGILGWFKFKSF